ncbi:hypothetical protein J6590_068133 [Homalodisca vitripennis]|nr:hypothetical protein J6590_068133 [Homalodisca vitripennis]
MNSACWQDVGLAKEIYFRGNQVRVMKLPCLTCCGCQAEVTPNRVPFQGHDATCDFAVSKNYWYESDMLWVPGRGNPQSELLVVSDMLWVPGRGNPQTGAVGFRDMTQHVTSQSVRIIGRGNPQSGAVGFRDMTQHVTSQSVRIIGSESDMFWVPGRESYDDLAQVSRMTSNAIRGIRRKKSSLSEVKVAVVGAPGVGKSDLYKVNLRTAHEARREVRSSREFTGLSLG